ncbi:MAG: hypothetical protein HKM07_07950 [Chlamydiae bacterium]|nr:hypothetical protein [Chlamydiota bacterium]
MKISQFYILNENENDTRRNWLIFTSIFFSSQVMNIALSWLDLLYGIFTLQQAVIITAVSGFAGVGIFLLYIFSYTRFGTKLLTTNFVLLGFGFLFGIRTLFKTFFQIIQGLNSLQIDPLSFFIMEIIHSWGGIILSFLTLTVTLWWYVLSWRLRKINHKIKHLHKLAKDTLELDKIIDRIKKTKNLEALDTVLYKSVAKLPQFESIISREYQTKKSILLEMSST